MASYTKQKLSGSTDGRGIKIVPTATPGTLIHTADATAWDEIWLWLTNTDASAIKATVEFGGTTSPDDTIEKTIQPEDGPKLIIPGLILTNSVIVRVFGSAANLLIAHGYVNRITN